MNEAATDRSFLGNLIYWVTKPFVILANFTRHLLLLIIFFIILWLVYGAEHVVLDNKTALVLAPKGFIVEQFSGDPASQAIQNIRGKSVPETRMRDLLRSIEKATTDKRIAVLVLNPDYLWGAGLANLRELERSVKKFKEKSGKPVVAIASGLTQSQYYFANMADEILMDPQGFFFLQGFGPFR
ncbi:MAG: S49 family peptidase, partial [Proteobacteria bacterium]|nr:S49 family peptidase [Pseudomonadota bacterium]